MIRSYKDIIKELLEVAPEGYVELAVHCICERHLLDNISLREYRDGLLRVYLELEVTADGFDGVTPNFSLFKHSNCSDCEFILETAYNKVEDERRREITAIFHQDDEVQEAFLFNLEEDKLYRFTRQSDNSFIEEENSYSRRFKKDIRHFFGTPLEVVEKTDDCISDIYLDLEEGETREGNRKIKEEIRKLIFKDRCEEYAHRNNLDYLPVTQDVHAWYSKRIYDKLSSEILNNKDFKKDLLFTNAPVYSDSTGTLRTDIATFKYVLKPEDGNCPTFKYALWTVSIVGEEGLADAQQKMDDILKKVVTINEAFLFDPTTKKWMRYTRQENDSVIVEEKSYSRYLQKYMGSLIS